jgi:uncharacterized membrane protein YkoI
MRRAPLLTCLLAGLLAAAAALPAQARREGRAPPDGARHERSTLDEAVSNVRRDTGGRVLSARKRGRDGDAGYRIKVLLPDATVRSFDVEARGRER